MDGCELVFCYECSLETLVPEKYVEEAMLGHLMTTDHVTGVRVPGTPRPSAEDIAWVLAAQHGLADG